MASRTKAHLPVGEETEETRVENFGRFLYESFEKTVHPSIFDLQLRYYGDYLHHFGFSIEAETRERILSFSATAASPNRNAGPSLQHDAMVFGDDAVADAGWGIGGAEQKEADERARAVGPLEGVRRPEEMTAKVVEPFQRVTWRQSATQCAMKKARALYCWLCENITVELSSYSSAAEEGASPKGVVGGPTTGAPGKKESGGKSAGASRGARRKPAADAHIPQVPVEVADPLETAMQQRTADPLTLARLYQKCLHHARVEGRVIEGRVRGRAPEESIEWAWNIVCIPQEENTVLRYLIDVALSCYTGPLRQATETKGTAEVAEPVKETNPKESGLRKSNRSVVPPKGKLTRSPLDDPVLASSAALEKRMESFYFNTPPQQFCANHFPKEWVDTLLLTPPRQVVWEGAPCLTHTFFRFPLALYSHRRRCSFTVRSTPFYITLVNEQPERTELCCFIYKGTLRALPEDCSTATPLGPQWLWHQREESTNCETFTLMVPEAGYYSVVVGARKIRHDPFTAVMGDEPFIPVVAYQVLVTFVPHQEPQLPRQYISPSVCKLIEPLTHQIPEGTTRFVVMPSCANVAGVAVVAKHQRDGVRELMTFLTFSPESVAYTGDATFTGGNEAEVWILYAAPDHNCVNTTELPRATPRIQQPNSNTLSGVGVSQSATPQTTQVTHAEETKLIFIPFVMGIEVRKFVIAAKVGGGCHIQPRPSIEEEQQPTLRRLIGVTPELYNEATATMSKKSKPVGSYFQEKTTLLRRTTGDV